ncbi:MAG TPA: HAD family hydrolase [Pseudonocardiaceae bacterium]|jgi:beta-phosphoglucomutase-like phosphatase (HAD superfamily)|nr:HAD family hydrolase [Pseudonocardiaceae bacterium]
MSSEIAALLGTADHVLVQFDGPVCSVFDATWRRTAAQRLTSLVGSDLPRKVAAADDPFAVLRFAEACGELTAQVVDRQLSRLESEAVFVGTQTPGAADALRLLFGAGYTVTIIGNIGVDAIRSFLIMSGLAEEVRRVSARGSARRTRLLPDPFLLNLAIEALGTSPDRCVFVAGSVAGVEAGKAAGVPVIGYATDGRERRRFLRHQADAVVETMSELDWSPGRLGAGAGGGPVDLPRPHAAGLT